MKNKLIIATLITCSVAVLSQSIQASEVKTASPNTAIQSASDFAHFSFPLSADNTLQSMHQASETISDEYWFQATGEQLNQGVEISSTQADTLIKITQGKAENGFNPAAKLDTALIKLASRQLPNQSAIGQLISQSQLSGSGLFDNAVVIKKSKQHPRGLLMLSSSQALGSTDLYMISVKEKNSPYQLKLSLPSQSYGEKHSVNAIAHLTRNGSKFRADEVNATLISPDGQKKPISFKANKNGGLSIDFSQPQNAIPPIKGLYEILLKANGKDKGLSIQRNAKLALAFTQDTARLVGLSLDENAAHATLNIDVAKESRFEVRAILYGTDLNGTLVPIMETHAAQTLAEGLDQLELPFNAEILAQSQTSAPFEVRNVRLFDQKQLGLIDSLTN